jgi:hypothetical protein
MDTGVPVVPGFPALMRKRWAARIGVRRLSLQRRHRVVRAEWQGAARCGRSPASALR